MTIFPLTLVSSMVCLLEMSFAQHQIRLRTFLSGSREFSKKDPDLGQTFRPVWDGQCQQWVVWPFFTLIHVMIRPQAAMGHAVKKGDENWIEIIPLDRFVREEIRPPLFKVISMERETINKNMIFLLLCWWFRFYSDLLNSTYLELPFSHSVEFLGIPGHFPHFVSTFATQKDPLEFDLPF